MFHTASNLVHAAEWFSWLSGILYSLCACISVKEGGRGGGVGEGAQHPMVRYLWVFGHLVRPTNIRMFALFYLHQSFLLQLRRTTCRRDEASN